MAVLLSFVAAALVVPVTAVEPARWFSSKDHPKTALSVAERGPLAYTIDVSPDGKAIRCRTQADADLDRKVCELLMKNARFLPAKDDQGRPALGVYEGTASFLLPGKNSRRPDPARLTFAIDRLPAGTTSPAYARVAFLVDSAGRISHCGSTTGERRRFPVVEALGPTACDRLALNHRPVPARDAAGNMVASVQSVMVRFETSPAS